MTISVLKWMAIIFVVAALCNVLAVVMEGAPLRGFMPGMCLLIPLGIVAAIIEQRVKEHRKAHPTKSPYQLQ